jgi:hypothetical protein
MTPNSGLYYYGTGEDVRLGDRVRIRRWIRSDLFGVVCYIPGISSRHPALEYEDVAKWAIRLDDGTVFAMGYDTVNKFGQPKKNLVLLSRGQDRLLDPDETLE